MGLLVDSVSIVPDDFKSDCGPAENVERFAKSVVENCRCEPLAPHIVTGQTALSVVLAKTLYNKTLNM